MRRATTLDEIKQILDPKPLRLDQLEEFFVETSDARDPMVARRDEITEILESGPNAKVLLAGHGGTGKSTELVKFRSEHKDRFGFVQLSMIEDGDPAKVNIESLLVLIVEAVLHQLRERDVPLDEQGLERIYSWFDQTFNIHEKNLSLTAESGSGIDSQDTFLGKLIGLTAYLKASIKTGSTTVSKTIHQDEHRLSDLAGQCGLILNEAKLALFEHRTEHLVLIIEDLDKIPVASADALFIDNPAPLGSLPIRAIFTAPIFLLCNPRATILDSHFDIVTMPMIKVEEQDGGRSESGWNTILEILEHRFDVANCIDEAGLDLAIAKTGGVLRHLFQTLRHAARAAGQAVQRGHREQGRISKADVRYGLDRLKTDIIRRIGVMGLPEEFSDLKTSDLFQRLEEFHKPQRAESDLINLLLMQAHALLEYNGKQWHRVHPLVAEHLEESKPT